ncbi:MAG: DUF6057 family protein [Bacteroidales bacterium]|nr:DUF6057 family protein [Bacteroidales bacterium]
MRKIIPLIFFVVAATYGFFRPELFNFNEQNQFFMFGAEYLMEHLAIPSEISGYVAEFLVQFFIIPILGSVILAGLLTAFGLVVRNLAEKYSGRECNTALAFLPSAAIATYFADEFVMLAFPVSLVISMLLARAYVSLDIHRRWMVQILALPLVYWITGYGVWPYIIVTLLFDVRKCNMKVDGALIQLSAMLVYILAFIMIMANTALVQFTYQHLMLGCNFYRWPMQWPVGQHICTVMTLAAVWLLGMVGTFRYADYLSTALTLAVLLIGSYTNYDKTRSMLLRMDYWVRFQKWEEIVAFSEKNPIANEMAVTATNLALAQMGQLPARFDQFPQMGMEGLVSSFKFNMVFNSTSAEVCYYLGFVNQALRFNYDSQAAISNKNMSARFSRRIAETYMLNGNFKAAHMYTARLRRTIFYSAFARKLDEAMANPEKINENPRWQRVNSCRISDNDYYFSPGSLHYLLGQMSKKSSGNPLVSQYFLVSSQLSNKDSNKK